MPLPIRDGNQSLTTLSTLIVNSAHVPAHTVVSLGSQAITDIAQAVSGVELGPNTLNALENITVTLGQVTITGGLTDTQLRASPVTIGGSVTSTIIGTPSVTFSSVQISNFPSSQAVTFGTAVITGSTSIVGTPSVTFSNPTITGSVSVLNFPSTQTIAGSVTIGASSITFNSNIAKRPDGSWQPLSVESGSNYVNARVYQNDFFPFLATVTVGNSVTISSIPNISGTITIGNSVSISNFPSTQTIAGTVTANVGVGSKIMILDSNGEDIISNPLNGALEVHVKNSVTIGSLPAISGTVTARLQDASGNNLTSTSIGGVQRLNVSLASATTAGGTLPSFINIHGGTDGSVARTMLLDSSGRTVVTVSNFPATQPVSGTVTANIPVAGAAGGNLLDYNGANSCLNIGIQKLGSLSLNQVSSLPVSGTITVGNTVTVSQSGTVTVVQSGSTTIGALPSGALTTRFGSVTTANTAQITSAVTNTSRKYLLAQNISAGTVTIGIGFSPTTTQGIQLTAGGGLTFDAFCPTGAVYWLGAVTGAAFTILEG